MMFWQFSLEHLAMWPPSHTFGLARLPDLIAKNKLHEALIRQHGSKMALGRCRYVRITSYGHPQQAKFLY
jgi:hypothetical protein